MDIRGFFGSTQKEDSGKKSGTDSSKKRTTTKNDDDEFVLEDSDDEKPIKQPQRKRLKSKSSVIDMTNEKNSTNDDDIVDLDEDFKNPTKNNKRSLNETVDFSKSPKNENKSKNRKIDKHSNVEVMDVEVEDEKIALPVLKPGLKGSNSSRIKKEIIGGPASFFGDKPTDTGLIKKETKKNEVKTEIKKSKSPSPSKVATLKKSSENKEPITNTGLCLEGLKIALSGVFNKSREEMEDLIKENGGKLSTAVSGKTDFLVIGDLLEDGRSVSEGRKHSTAVEKKVKILTEDEFLQKIENAPKPKTSLTLAPTLAPMEFPEWKPKAEVNESEMLWVDKYKPKSGAELIGSADLVKKLSNWLRNWDAVHLQKTLKISFNKENPGARAALLSGPPGIGKTTVATLIAKEMNYDVLELNASDTRNKKEVESILTTASTTRTINLGGSMQQSSSSNSKSGGIGRRLIIMDEVDGMGGSDRGGIGELIKVIKSTKTPIICICNDRQNQKIRSLVNHCFDLKVRRPTKQQISNRLVQIAAKENLSVESNAAEMLVEQAGNDIRQALNAMQMWKASSSAMNYGDVKLGMGRIEKDKVLRHSAFDACLQILTGQRVDFQERYNAFFIDYSLVPLLIQQNYIESAKNGIFKNANMSDEMKMDSLAAAADAVSDSELAGSSIMGQNQHWELLPTQAALCLRAGSKVNGFQAFPSFPAWLGKHSTRSKMTRLTKEIVHHTSLFIGQGFMSIRLDYIPCLRNVLIKCLTTEGINGVEQAIEFLDSYGLSREDFMENMKELQFLVDNDKTLVDKYLLLDTRLKTSFTKTYNSKSHKSQVLVSELATKGVKKGRGSAADTSVEVVFNEEGVPQESELTTAAVVEEENENENDTEDISALVAKKPKKATKTSKPKNTGETKTGKGSKKKG